MSRKQGSGEFPMHPDDDDDDDEPSQVTVKAKLIQNVSVAENKLHVAQQKLLNGCGWTYSSTHPDFIWRWSKEFDGKKYVMNATDAVHMEFSLEE